MDKPTTLNISFIVTIQSRMGIRTLKHKIGLVYLPGALPCFEAFGNLPTHLIREDATVEGKPASEALDMIIIPGGSLVESQTIKGNVKREILKMADASKFVLGICSGFQILSKGTDIGRLSPTPIFREGLGLIDAEFKPLICTDQVQATVVGASYLTDEVGAEVSGFHCHTYGDVTLHQDAKPILVSHVKRVNYFGAPRDLTSGIANKEGNVVGVIVHALLEQNPLIIRGICKSLDISPEELGEIRAANAKLLPEIRGEVGVSTQVHAAERKNPQKAAGTPTLAGALRKRGFHVGIVKVGADIRDTVPALYLTKEPIHSYSSIRVADSGWKPLPEVLQQANKDYNLLMVEGAMSAFTGLLMGKVERPSSTAEIAAALGAPTVLVAACDNEGIEGAMVTTLSYVKLMRDLGVKMAGVILNKAKLSYITKEAMQLIKQAYANVGVELLGVVPRIDLEGRGAIPEVEIRYEEFGAKAIQAAEQNINIDRIVQVAAPADLKQVDYGAFMEKFKKSLTNNTVNASERHEE